MKYKNHINEKYYRMSDGGKSQIGGRLIQLFKKQVEKLPRSGNAKQLNAEWKKFCKKTADKMIKDYVIAAAKKAWKKDYYDGAVTAIGYTGAKTGVWIPSNDSTYQSSDYQDFYVLKGDFIVNVECADDADASRLNSVMKGFQTNDAIGRRDNIVGSISGENNAVEARDSFLLGSQ